MEKRSAILAACALLLLSACDPSGGKKGDLAVQTIDYKLGADGYYRFYTNDLANCLGGSGYFSKYLDDSFAPMHSVEIEAAKDSGKSGYMYGIVFCYADVDRYYRLLISPWGDYEVFKHGPDSHQWWNFETPGWSATSAFTYPTSPNLKTGYGQVNKLKVARDASTGRFDIFFNDAASASASFTDAEYSGGKNGFMTFVGLPADEDFPNVPVDVRYKPISQD
jgi:hypothetical protein